MKCFEGMVTLATLRKLSLALPEASEEPHFEKTSFRVKKKIFATYDASNHRACIKLSVVHQSVYEGIDGEMIYPVPNKWGKQGWTFIDLNKIDKKLLSEVLNLAYVEVAPPKLTQALGQGMKN